MIQSKSFEAHNRTLQGNSQAQVAECGENEEVDVEADLRADWDPLDANLDLARLQHEHRGGYT